MKEIRVNEQDLIIQAINAMESQRSILGDEVVNPAITALREKLATLHTQSSAGQRKQVTILFGDLVGFTAMSEKMDAEQVGDLMNALWKHLDAIIVERGGMIEKHIGDAVVAIWGASEAQENDPEQAVHTALALQDELKRLAKERAQPLRMRIGIHTGLVYVTASDTPGKLNVTGMPLQLVESIQHAAPPDGILVTHDTMLHIQGVFNVNPLEALALKEIPNPMPVFEILSARPRAFRIGSRGIEGIETRMVGRDEELQHLQEMFLDVIQNRILHMVTITGDAGIGKSRLLHEFSQWGDGIPHRVRFFKGRASLDMQRLPYSLLRDLFSFRFQIQDTDDATTVWKKVEKGVAEALESDPEDKVNLYAHFIGYLIGFDFSKSPLLSGVLADSRQIFNRAIGYLGEYFQSLSDHQPVLILLEDIHWADEASLGAIQQIASMLENCPVLIASTARSEFYEHNPEWGKTGERLQLEPLDTNRSRELVEHILQKIAAPPETLIELMITSAEGNPFYVEELIKMLIEDQVILKGEETWQVDTTRLNTARVPSTLTGVLQARLDSLQTYERQALQSASVVGPIFWDAVVANLVVQPGRAELPNPAEIDEILNQLRAKEMIYRRDKSVFAGMLEYIFKNAMLREVTYGSIAKPERRSRHARVANWLIQTTALSGRQDEYARLVAEHFERADEMTQAAEWFARAAQQAAARYVIQEAVDCYSRALELTPGKDLAARYALLSGRERMYDLQAERAAQVQDLEAISSLADQLGDPRMHVQAALRRANYGLVTGNYIPAMQAGEQAYAQAEAIPDVPLQAHAALDWAQALWRQSDYQQSREKLQLALGLARQAGTKALEAEALRNLGVIEEDLGNYPQAGAYYQQALTIYQQIDDRAGEGNTYSSLGNLAIDLNDHTSSIAYHEMALQLRRETGDRRGQARSLGNLGFIASDQGDYAASQGYFEQALRLFRQIEDRQGEAVALVNLGNDAMIQGNYSAAKTYQEQALNIQREINNRMGESIALDNLCLIAHFMGDQHKALEYADQALQIAQAVNLRHVIGYIQNHHAHALLALGRLDEAQTAYQLSLELRHELGEHNLALEAQAGLVRVALARGDISTAGQMAGKLYQALQNNTLDGMVEPLRCYLTVFQAMQAAEEPQAKEILRQARQLLEERAAKILDPKLRRSFMENVLAHRQIMEFSQSLDPDRQQPGG